MPLLALASDTESLRVEWVVPAQPDRLWSCLTEDAALSQWLGGLVQGHVGPGRSFVVDHGEGACSSSTVLECTAGISINYTWDFPDEPTSEVSWTLSTHDEGTTVHLTHTGLGDLTTSYTNGWIVHLTYLEAAALGTPLPGRMFWQLHSTVARLRLHG